MRLEAVAVSVLLLIALLLTATACTTGSGGSASVSVGADLERAGGDADAAGDDGEDPDVEEEELELDELTIESDPDDAAVYLNGDYVGQTPITISDLDYGRYRVEISADGYHALFEQLFYEGGEESYYYELEQITGFLDVAVSPVDAELTVDGEELVSGVNEVGIGRRLVRARLFGYEEQNAEVAIRETRTSRLSFTLTPSAFRLSDLRVHRPVVNLESPGLLGWVRLNFWVSAPGATTLAARSAGGTPVRSFELGAFDTWEQAVSWDGRDDAGELVPAGDYLIRIAGPGSQVEAQVTIDYSATVSYRSIWSGVSGGMVSATADVLPREVVQTSLTAVGHSGLDAIDNPRLRFPVAVGARIGAGSGLEVNAAVTAVAMEGAAATPLGGSVAAKWRFFRANLGAARLRLAAAVRAAVELDPRTDSFTNFPGLGMMVPATLGLGQVELSVAPEVVVSPVEPLHQPGDTQDAPWEGWAYLRAALFVDFGSIVASASAALRTEPFDSGLALATDLPLKVGADIHFLIPDTLLYVGAAGLLELSDASDYFLQGGVGVGLLF